MSTTRTILICSGKGGVGKTTTTANLGIALARQGAKTVVLDADFGLRNLDLLLGLENRIVYTAQEVLAETCRLEQGTAQMVPPFEGCETGRRIGRFATRAVTRSSVSRLTSPSSRSIST